MIRDERGAASVEAVLVVPIIVVCAMVAVLGGRLSWARSGIETASQSAARAAAGADTVAEGQSHGIAAGELALAGLPCEQRSIDVDAHELAYGAGRAGTARVTIQCVVPLHDLLLPGVPGSMEVTAAANAPIDTYRRKS